MEPHQLATALLDEHQEKPPRKLKSQNLIRPCWSCRKQNTNTFIYSKVSQWQMLFAMLTFIPELSKRTLGRAITWLISTISYYMCVTEYNFILFLLFVLCCIKVGKQIFQRRCFHRRNSTRFENTKVSSYHQIFIRYHIVRIRLAF